MARNSEGVEPTAIEALVDSGKEPSVQGTCVAQVVRSLNLVLLGSKLNILLLFFPLAVVFDILEVDSATFVCSLIALMPLAERLGFVTEDLAMYTNDTLGGLLNATFGNATELIICAVSLYKAGKEHDRTYLRIVQLSLLGSIMGNLLFVLGTAFLVGGIKNPSQKFNREGMGVNSGMLIVAVSGILLPSTLSMTDTGAKPGSALHLSRFESVVMLGLYVLYLVFQLGTHKHLYEQDSSGPSTSATNPRNVSRLATLEGHRLHLQSSESLNVEDGRKVEYFEKPAQMHRSKTLLRQDDSHIDIEHDVEEEGMGVLVSLLWLGIITVVIAFLSNMVVETIEDAHDSLGIPMPFLSTVVLPIVGNAAEHASAILFAYKNKMEITLGVAVGSSTQIAVLVIPLTVVLAWIMDQPLDLNFEWFEAFTLFLCVMVTITAVTDGSSNWIKGLLMMVTYSLIAAAFWVHSDTDLSGTKKPDS